MKKMNRIKLALDVLMLLVLILMYRKNVLGMSFHEIGGLALCGVIIIHKLLNGKWILVITGKLFSKKIAWRCKLNWMLDFLLLLCVTYILISGILISKVLFEGTQGASAFKTGHYAVSALALALVGIHLGLHYESVILRTPARKLPLWFRRGAAIGMSVLILGFGVYQMAETSFLRWMSELGVVVGTTDALPAGDFDELPAGLADGEDGAVSLNDETHTEFVTGGHGNGTRDGSGGGQGNGGGGGGGGGGDTAADPAALPGVLLNFLSITLAFSVVTAWIDGILRTRRRNRLLRCKLPA